MSLYEVKFTGHIHHHRSHTYQTIRCVCVCACVYVCAYQTIRCVCVCACVYVCACMYGMCVCLLTAFSARSARGRCGRLPSPAMSRRDLHVACRGRLPCFSVPTPTSLHVTGTVPRRHASFHPNRSLEVVPPPTRRGAAGKQKQGGGNGGRGPCAGARTAAGAGSRARSSRQHESAELIIPPRPYSSL
jgi:hypothetical protein